MLRIVEIEIQNQRKFSQRTIKRTTEFHKVLREWKVTSFYRNRERAR